MFNLENMDFTTHKFQSLCETVSSNYPTITMKEYFEGSYDERFIIMRHDVDRMPGHALEAAKIEHKFGIRSTYYFRAIKGVFDPNIMKQIEDMGHEIGYHYEDLSLAKGDMKKAIELFNLNLEKFRKISDIKTICMHGRPLSKYDNREIWKHCSLEDFELLGEAYLSAGKELNYFSDTGRSWNSKNNVRDHMSFAKASTLEETTDDIINLISSSKFSNYYILTHPHRWARSSINWGLCLGEDIAFNLGKRALMAVRK